MSLSLERCLTIWQLETLREIEQATGTSVTELVRLAVDGYLVRRNGRTETDGRGVGVISPDPDDATAVDNLIPAPVGRGGLNYRLRGDRSGTSPGPALTEHCERE